MAKLVAQSGPTTGREYPLVKPVTVLGRQSSCDVQVVDTMASRAQCELRRDDRFFSLVDLGSRNGTQLNGRKVAERMLFFGDRIRIGEVEFLFAKEPGDVELKDLLTKYDLQEKIGEGGMGLVFKAVQRSMARQVALKILSPRFSQNQKWVDQFINEARAAGKLNHQNIIQVHDVSTENGIHYFSMEYVDGPTCMQMLRQHGTLEVEPALEITRQVARALEYAHTQRLIHHDIKPDNIMVGSNEVVKLADLGISKSFDEAAVVRPDGEPLRLMGTPHYLAPEAAMGRQIDHRIDIYALGATLYHLLTGKTPYRGVDATHILKAHINDPVPVPSALVPTLSGDLDALVVRMLAKDPAERFQHASEIEAEITRILSARGATSGQTGKDTVVLHRYASTVMSRGDADTGPATAEAKAPAAMGGSTGMIAGVVVVAAAVAVMAFLLGRSKTTGEEASSVTSATASAMAVPAPATAAQQATVKPVPVPEVSSSVAEAALIDLERQLMRPVDQIPYDSLPKRLKDIPETGLDTTLAARRKRLANAVATAIERHRHEEMFDTLTKLQSEAGKAAETRDYVKALSILESFPGRADPMFTDRYNAAVDTIKSDRDRYASDCQDQIRQLTLHRDRDGLAKFGEGLNESWKTGAVADSLKAAIAKLDGERAVMLTEIATQADRFLVTWNLSGLEDLAQQRKADIAGTPVAERIAKHRANLKTLQELPVAIGDRLRVARSIRFPGILAGLSEPDLVGADAVDGLELREAGGGSVKLRWDRIRSAELRSIAEQVLKADAKRFAEAIAALDAK